jgi:DNA-binding transcriptional regulator LsrR (DeoR family)
VNTLLIDKKGRPFPSPVSELFIGLGYDDLRKISMVIGLSGGPQKHVAIKAALLGGYLGVLVTDRGTAEYLME